jgi:hypothetical protein
MNLGVKNSSDLQFFFIVMFLLFSTTNLFAQQINKISYNSGYQLLNNTPLQE